MPTPIAKFFKAERYFSVPIILISVLTGWCAYLLVISEVHLTLPGTALLTDLREIFVTISAALTGPVGAIITSILAGWYDPSAELRYYIVAQHIFPSLLLSVLYRYFVLPFNGKRLFYLRWTGIIFIYYYIAYLPIYIITAYFFPDIYAILNNAGKPLLISVIDNAIGWSPEVFFTAFTTSLFWLCTPFRYRRPLWGRAEKRTSISFSFSSISEKIKEFRGLSLRVFSLSVLFLLIPVISMVMIIRNNIVEQWLISEANKLQELAVIHATLLQFEKGKPVIQTTNEPQTRSDLLYFYSTGEVSALAGTDDTLLTQNLKNFPALASLIKNQKKGTWYNKNLMHALAFCRNEKLNVAVICFNNGTDINRLSGEIPANITRTFGSVLLIISVLLAVIIWVMIGKPVKAITEFAKNVSNGKFSDQLDEDAMEDEIKLLSQSLNRMQTNIKHTMEALKNREFLLVTVLDNTPVIHIVLDNAGTVQLIHGKGLEALHLDPTQLLGESAFRTIASHPELFRIVCKAYTGKAERGIFKINDVVLDFYICPILSDEGTTKSVIGVAYDITEQVNLEQELRGAVQRAEQSDKLKSGILANLSHEFRTPLNGILGYSSILMDSVTDPEELRMLNKISKAGRRLLRTLNSVMSITEIESGIVKVFHQPVNISAVIYQAVKPYLSDATEKNIEIIIPDHDSGFPVVTDELILTQLLTNLIDNAVKFTEKGSIKISVRLESEQESAFTVISVNDTGSGIPPESLDFIFQDFTQLSEGYSRHFEGLGLGLPNSQRLAKLIGAVLSVKSMVGEGSEFLVRLPLKK